MPKNTTTSALSSTKEEKNYDFMQNLTSKYNILYHSNLLLNQEQAYISSSKKPNYQTRIAVFDEPAANGDAHPAMDSVIAKVYKIIHHKQQSKYIQEAYYHLAQANYLKGAYHQAIAYLDLLIKEQGIDSAYYKPLAYAWKSRAWLQLNRIEPARLAIDSALRYSLEKGKVQTFVYAGCANYYVKTESNNEAIKFLEKALASTRRSKEEKFRWTFLLAQLYLEQGDTLRAETFFNQIAKANVSFDLAFAASLQASSMASSKYTTVDKRVKPFKKLLKEGKNQGYKDQILYEIGKIYLLEGAEEQALSYFDQSLRHSVDNAYQAATTYLTLIDYYLQKKRYKEAQPNVDMAMQVLPADYKEVNKIRRELGYMNELIDLYDQNLEIDTVLYLASLNAKQLDSVISVFAEGQWAEYRSKNQIQADKEHDRRMQPSSNPSPSLTNHTPAINNSPDQFYFNNPDALMVGAVAFKSRWGNRQLQDDWRYVLAETSPLIVPTVAISSTTTFVPRVEDDQELFLKAQRNRYSNAVSASSRHPDSLHQLWQTNQLYVATIYREYIKDKEKAIVAYKELLARYPNSPYGSEIYYAFYRLYEDFDQEASVQYKNKLLDEYPTSIHAEALRHPNFLDKIKSEKALLDQAYEQLYTLYVQNKFSELIDKTNLLLSNNQHHRGFMAQIAYLKTLAIGRMESTNAFTNSLQQLIAAYPKDSLITPLAKEHLAYMEDNPSFFAGRSVALQENDVHRLTFIDQPHMTEWPALRKEKDYPTAADMRDSATVHIISTEIANQDLKPTTVLVKNETNNFTGKDLFPAEADYYFVVNVNKNNINLSPSRYGIGQFIRTQFSRTKLNHQLKAVGDENQLILIGTFGTWQAVKGFESKFLRMINDIMKIPTENYNTFVVTKENLDTFTDRIYLNDYYQIYTGK